MKLNSLHIIILILIGAVVFLSIRSCNKSNEADKYKQLADLEAAKNDTLAVRYNEATGDLEYSKQAYAASEKVLEDYLKEHDKELAALQKDGNKVGIRTETVVKIDTLVQNNTDTVYANDTRVADIRTPDYNAYITSTPKTTALKLRLFDTVGYSLDKDYRLKATHTNPYLEVTEINSFYVKPENKRKNFKYWIGAVVGGVIVWGVTR